MSHSFHISLNTILKKLPQTNKYYFYLTPNYRQLQQKLERITEDLSLVTIRCNADVITVLFEYVGTGYNKEVHEKAIKLVEGNYIFLYQHENPDLKVNRNMLRYLQHPDECNQVYLYHENERAQKGNGYLVLAAEGENMIYPAMQPVGEPLPPNSLCALEFTRPTRQMVYLDLNPLGKKPSIIKMSESVMFSVPQQEQPFIMRNLNQIWKEYSKTHPVTTTGNNKKIIQVVANAAEGQFEQWQAYAKELPYITQRRIYVENGNQIIMTTKLPSVKTRLLTPGEKLYLTPQYKVLTTEERGIHVRPIIISAQQLPPTMQTQNNQINTLVQQQIAQQVQNQIQQQPIPEGYYAQVQLRPAAPKCMQIHHVGLAQQEEKEEQKE